MCVLYIIASHELAVALRVVFRMSAVRWRLNHRAAPRVNLPTLHVSIRRHSRRDSCLTWFQSVNQWVSLSRAVTCRARQSHRPPVSRITLKSPRVFIGHVWALPTMTSAQASQNLSTIMILVLVYNLWFYVSCSAFTLWSSHGKCYEISSIFVRSHCMHGMRRCCLLLQMWCGLYVC